MQLGRRGILLRARTAQPRNPDPRHSRGLTINGRGGRTCSRRLHRHRPSEPPTTTNSKHGHASDWYKAAIPQAEHAYAEHLLFEEKK